MPGFLLDATATVMCSHGGQAMAGAPDPRLKLGGPPAVTQTANHTLAGCSFTTPGGTPLPCVNAPWVVPAVRVKATGVPVLLQDSQAITIPNGVPLSTIVTQPRVKGM